MRVVFAEEGGRNRRKLQARFGNEELPDEAQQLLDHFCFLIPPSLAIEELAQVAPNS